MSISDQIQAAEAKAREAQEAAEAELVELRRKAMLAGEQESLRAKIAARAATEALHGKAIDAIAAASKAVEALKAQAVGSSAREADTVATALGRAMQHLHTQAADFVVSPADTKRVADIAAELE